MLRGNRHPLDAYGLPPALVKSVSRALSKILQDCDKQFAPYTLTRSASCTCAPAFPSDICCFFRLAGWRQRGSVKFAPLASNPKSCLLNSLCMMQEHGRDRAKGAVAGSGSVWHGSALRSLHPP